MPLKNPAERLLGFDAREMWLNFDTEWPQDRKNSFLLRPDIDKPLSTDTMVWSSVFGLDDKLEPPPPWEALDLWVDIQKLKVRLSTGWGSSRRLHWIIGFTLLFGAFGEDDLKHGYPTLNSVQLHDHSSEWVFLGYDISNGSGLSGLSNCGYAPGERNPLRDQWSPHLNKYHLFTDETRATQFKKMRDQHMLEHAPFFVYGLYLIEDHSK